MTRFYFHYHDGVDRILDPEGADLTIDEARTRALGEVRALIAHDALVGRIDLRQWIDIENVEGIILETIAFADAVEIIGLPPPPPPPPPLPPPLSEPRAVENGADVTGSTGSP